MTSTTDGKSYTYDLNGNMKNDGVRSIEYNYDNMPVSVTVSGATSTFIYDGAGARVMKLSPSTGTTVYIGKLQECRAGACTNYIYAGGTRIASKSWNEVYYYHQDHLGSTRVLTDKNGQVMENIAYYPFGGTQSDAGAASVGHKYTGQEFDAETGLYNYNARFYNPALGRFISADTIVPDASNPQLLNRYSYVINSPLNYIDLSGYEYDAYIDLWPYGGGGYTGGYGGYYNYYDYLSSPPPTNNYYGSYTGGSNSQTSNIDGIVNSSTPLGDIGLVQGLNISIQLFEVLKFELNYGSDELWLFSGEKVTQNFQFTAGRKPWGVGYGIGRSALGQSSLARFDHRGKYIPGSSRSYFSVLKGSEWIELPSVLTNRNMSLEYENNGDFILQGGATFFIGFKGFFNLSEFGRRWHNSSLHRGLTVFSPNPRPQRTMDCHAPIYY